MGVRNTLISIIRPTVTRTSTAPSLFHGKHITRKLITRSVGLVAIASVVGAATAADNATQQAQATTPNSNTTHTTIDLSTDPTPAPESTQNQSQTDAGGTTTNTAGTSGNSSNVSNVTYNLTVNGQPIDVPENGSASQVVTTPDATTTVNVNATTGTSGNNFSSTTTTNQSNGFSSDITHSSVIEQRYGAP